MKVRMLSLLFFFLLIGAAILAQTTKRLNNEGILQMLNAGFDEETIIKAVRANEPAFDTSAQALVELKNDGVSQAIIKAMLEARAENDSCARLPIPKLTEKEAKAILNWRKKLTCDEIYNDRTARVEAALKVLEKRLLQIGLETGTEIDLTPVTELGYIIALKEKTLCIIFRGNPEMTEELRQCRAQRIEEWEKDIARIVKQNEEREREHRKLPNIFPQEKLKSQLRQDLIEALQVTYSDGVRLGQQMDEYELKLWKLAEKE